MVAGDQHDVLAFSRTFPSLENDAGTGGVQRGGKGGE
jgi:hypothetical protein